MSTPARLACCQRPAYGGREAGIEFICSPAQWRPDAPTPPQWPPCPSEAPCASQFSKHGVFLTDRHGRIPSMPRALKLTPPFNRKFLRLEDAQKGAGLSDVELHCGSCVILYPGTNGDRSDAIFRMLRGGSSFSIPTAFRSSVGLVFYRQPCRLRCQCRRWMFCYCCAVAASLNILRGSF